MNNSRIRPILIAVAVIAGIGLISFVFPNTLLRLDHLVRAMASLVQISATVPAHCSITSIDGREITEGEQPSTTSAVPTFAGFVNIKQGNLTFEIDNGLITGASRADTQGYWSWSPFPQRLSPEAYSLYVTAEHPNDSSIKATCALDFRVVEVSIGSGGRRLPSPPTLPPSPLSPEAQKIDANKDDKINLLDFNLLMVNWGAAAGNIADFNDDGIVDIFDFNLLMVHWTR